jgi:uncharacterized protein
MTRSFGLVALVAVGAAQFAGTVSLAQTAPSERELRIYAGLHDAAARGNAAEIEQLIAEGEKPNIQDANSRTPLHVAAFLRRYEAARALIAAKAPLNHVNDFGRTALLEAVVLGNGGRNHTAAVEALVEAGADVTLPDRHGITALQHARTRGYSQIARILENAGAH